MPVCCALAVSTWSLTWKSTNGTFVNEQKVNTQELADGDQIRIGKTVIRYTESHVEREYFEHIMSLASEDALTGAYNKRKFDELFAAEIARAQSAGSFAFVLFDIDFFKRITTSMVTLRVMPCSAGSPTLRTVSSALPVPCAEWGARNLRSCYRVWAVRRPRSSPSSCAKPSRTSTSASRIA